MLALKRMKSALLAGHTIFAGKCCLLRFLAQSENHLPGVPNYQNYFLHTPKNYLGRLPVRVKLTIQKPLNEEQ